jgi:hypothetical protein
MMLSGEGVLLRVFIGEMIDDGLPAVSDRPQSGRPVDRRPVVVTELQVGGTRVQRRPDPHRTRCRPLGGGETGLDLRDRAKGVACVIEHQEPAVTLASGLHRGPAVRLDRLVDDLVVLTQRSRHRLRRFLPHPGAALYVGEDEGDDAVGEIGHGRSSYGRLLLNIQAPGWLCLC